jgi:hypothetical protein
MKAREAISKTVPLLNKEDLQKTYPQDFLGKDVTTEYFLIHLLSHFDYYLGQINYLRRIL